MSTSQHYPVLFREALEALNIRPDGSYVDGTFGRGGHSRGILQRLGEQGRLLALDRDAEAASAAASIHDQRFEFIAAPFSSLATVAEDQGMHGRLDGVLLDLGVSSPQLDSPERGFSFMRDGPLDMRMDTTSGIRAQDWLAEAAEGEMLRVLWDYGEERFARRIVAAIMAQRLISPITTTAQLAALIAAAVPKRERDKHPATRSFQAIRIHINNELDELRFGLRAALEALAPQGRLVVISFHSLEDRIVKRFMRDQAQGDKIPKGVPVTGERFNARLTVVGRKRTAQRDELAENPRSRSAVLRVAAKLA